MTQTEMTTGFIFFLGMLCVSPGYLKKQVVWGFALPAELANTQLRVSV
ncbi:hypothetical protein VCJ_002217 [Vibrio metoecus]|nr:hypothetical protein VCJ_002217 [Vibrio metoecus]